MRWRSAAKTVLERALAYSGAARAARRRRQADVLILAYHNVIPHGERSVGERSLHIALADFSEQLDVLADTHEIVSLANVLTEHREESKRPRAVLTFDDAYRGAITSGIDAAVARGLPTTVFIAPSFIGGASFWWDALADPATGEMPPSFRHRALWQHRGADAEVRTFATKESRPAQQMPDHATCAHTHELKEAATRPGVSFGSHGWSHANLASLDERSLQSELSDSHRWLQSEYPNCAIAHISYPYGLSSSQVEKLASAEGFAAGLLIEGGWHRPGHDPRYALPRLNIPANLSRDGFLIRTSGMTLSR